MKTIKEASQDRGTYTFVTLVASVKTDLARFSMARGCTAEKWRDISSPVYVFSKSANLWKTF